MSIPKHVIVELRAKIRTLEAEREELLGEVQEAHAQRALAPGLECTCKWCKQDG